MDEMAQKLVRSRTPDVWDWNANMIGAAAGLAAHRIALVVVDFLTSRPGVMTSEHPPE